MKTLAPECRRRLERCGYHLDASRDYWLKNDVERGALRISAREVERNGIVWLEEKLQQLAAPPARRAGQPPQ
jgi:hypothetical protein